MDLQDLENILGNIRLRIGESQIAQEFTRGILKTRRIEGDLAELAYIATFQMQELLTHSGLSEEANSSVLAAFDHVLLGYFGAFDQRFIDVHEAIGKSYRASLPEISIKGEIVQRGDLFYVPHMCSYNQSMMMLHVGSADSDVAITVSSSFGRAYASGILIAYMLDHPGEVVTFEQVSVISGIRAPATLNRLHNTIAHSKHYSLVSVPGFKPNMYRMDRKL